jgi:serine/threonine protein kinase
MALSCEHLEDYELGGYHPVHLDHTFNDRFVVEHKFGHGANSPVWLARGLQTSRCVALKILRADATKTMQQFDLLSLRHLNTAVAPQPSGWTSYLPAFLRQDNGTEPTSLFPRIIHDFKIHGPNGDHL